MKENVENRKTIERYMNLHLGKGDNIVNGNIVKWGTKQFFRNYESSSITVLTVIELLKFEYMKLSNFFT